MSDPSPPTSRRGRGASGSRADGSSRRSGIPTTRSRRQASPGRDGPEEEKSNALSTEANAISIGGQDQDQTEDQDQDYESDMTIYHGMDFDFDDNDDHDDHDDPDDNDDYDDNDDNDDNPDAAQRGPDDEPPAPDQPAAPGVGPRADVSRLVPIFLPSVKSTAPDSDCTRVINKMYVESQLQYDVEDVDSACRLKQDIASCISVVSIMNQGKGSPALTDTAMWDLIKTNVTNAKSGVLGGNEALHLYGTFLCEFLQIDDVYRHFCDTVNREGQRELDVDDDPVRLAALEAASHFTVVHDETLTLMATLALEHALDAPAKFQRATRLIIQVIATGCLLPAHDVKKKLEQFAGMIPDHQPPATSTRPPPPPAAKPASTAVSSVPLKLDPFFKSTVKAMGSRGFVSTAYDAVSGGMQFGDKVEDVLQAKAIAEASTLRDLLTAVMPALGSMAIGGLVPGAGEIIAESYDRSSIEPANVEDGWQKVGDANAKALRGVQERADKEMKSSSDSLFFKYLVALSKEGARSDNTKKAFVKALMYVMFGDAVSVPGADPESILDDIYRRFHATPSFAGELVPKALLPYVQDQLPDPRGNNGPSGSTVGGARLSSGSTSRRKTAFSSATSTARQSNASVATSPSATALSGAGDARVQREALTTRNKLLALSQVALVSQATTSYAILANESHLFALDILSSASTKIGEIIIHWLQHIVEHPETNVARSIKGYLDLSQATEMINVITKMTMEGHPETCGHEVSCDGPDDEIFVDTSGGGFFPCSVEGFNIRPTMNNVLAVTYRSNVFSVFNVFNYLHDVAGVPRQVKSALTGLFTALNFGSGLHVDLLLEHKRDTYAAVLNAVVTSTPMTEFAKVFQSIGIPVEKVLLNGSEHIVPVCLNSDFMLGLNIIQAFENPKKEGSAFEQTFTISLQQEIMESSNPVEMALRYYELHVANAQLQQRVAGAKVSHSSSLANAAKFKNHLKAFGVNIHSGSSSRLKGPGFAGTVVNVFSAFPDEGSSKGSKKGEPSKGDKDKSVKNDDPVIGLAYNARENCTVDQLREAASKDSKVSKKDFFVLLIRYWCGYGDRDDKLKELRPILLSVGVPGDMVSALMTRTIPPKDKAKLLYVQDRKGTGRPNFGLINFSINNPDKVRAYARLPSKGQAAVDFLRDFGIPPPQRDGYCRTVTDILDDKYGKGKWTIDSVSSEVFDKLRVMPPKRHGPPIGSVVVADDDDVAAEEEIGGDDDVASQSGKKRKKPRDKKSKKAQLGETLRKKEEDEKRLLLLREKAVKLEVDLNAKAIVQYAKGTNDGSAGGAKITSNPNKIANTSTDGTGAQEDGPSDDAALELAKTRAEIEKLQN